MISLKNPYLVKWRKLILIPLFTFSRRILQQSKGKFINTYEYLINIDQIPNNNNVMTLSYHHHHLCQANQWMKQNTLYLDNYYGTSLHTVHHATTHALVRLPMYREISAIKQHCSYCEHLRQWRSQQRIKDTPAGNILLSVAILFSGATPGKDLRMLNHMKVAYGSLT